MRVARVVCRQESLTRSLRCQQPKHSSLWVSTAVVRFLLYTREEVYLREMEEENLNQKSFAALKELEAIEEVITSTTLIYSYLVSISHNR